MQALPERVAMPLERPVGKPEYPLKLSLAAKTPEAGFSRIAATPTFSL
jgi:hypothetical protein